MKISHIHVDGYGVLCNLDVEPATDGLTVIHGANEAGKSTLLDFVRGVLFGFPDRRHREPYHEPLHGGRHGGSVTVEDDAGERWRISRHTDASRLEVTSSDGNLADSDVLRHVLGGADDKLFKSVFAFGLGELSNFETLDSDDVRDLVFSAGVLGAGRSATRAVRALEQRRAALLRPRQKDARINQLRERLTDVDARLRSARSVAESYGEALASYEQLEAQTQHTTDEIDTSRRRMSEITLLQTCWPISRRGDEADSELRRLGETALLERELLQRESEIEQLRAEQSGVAQRLQHHREQAGQYAGIEREIASVCRQLGPDMDLERLASIPLGVVSRTNATELAENHRNLRAEQHLLEDEFRRAAEDLEEQMARSTAESTQRSARPDGELRDLQVAVGDLKALVATRDRQIAAHDAAEHERAIARLSAGRRSIPAARRGAIAALAVICLVLLAGAMALAYRHLVGAAIGAGVAFVLGVFAALRVASATDEHRDEADDGPHHEELAQLEQQISDRARAVSLGELPNIVEIDATQRRLDEERADRRVLDDLARTEMTAARRLDAVRARLEAQNDRLLSLESRAATYAKALGFSAELSPSQLVEVITALDRLRELGEARERLGDRLGATEAEIDAYCGRLEIVCKAGEVPIADLSSAEDVGSALSTLYEKLLAARESDSARDHAREIAEQASADIDAALGQGPDAFRLRSELRRGEVLEWQSEDDRLHDTIDALGTRHEADLSNQHDAQRALRECERSDEIASLELEREGLETDLSEAIAEWTALGLAQVLLTRTLDRYEQEHQPRVIATAAELFCAITEGRYEGLVAREDDDTRRHGIVALSSSGQRVDAGDLSRGTSEQLYLCLRLAFAMTFAERAVSLPLVLDDVLVNFDPARARAVARAIVATSREHQVLAFTCHPHVVEYFTAAGKNVKVLELTPEQSSSTHTALSR